MFAIFALLTMDCPFFFLLGELVRLCHAVSCFLILDHLLLEDFVFLPSIKVSCIVSFCCTVVVIFGGPVQFWTLGVVSATAT